MATTSYRVRYFGDSRNFQAHEHLNTKDHSTVLVGKWGDSDDLSSLCIIKVNEYGELLWSKKLDQQFRLYYHKICETTDGSIVFSGSAFVAFPPYNLEMYLMKFDCQGNIAWSKKVAMKAGIAQKYLQTFSLTAGKDNDFILTYFNGEINARLLVVCRFNRDGMVVWSKTIYSNEMDYYHPSVAFVAGDDLYVFGNDAKFTNFWWYDKRFYATLLSYQSGSVKEAKVFNYSEFITNNSVLSTTPEIHFYAQQLSNGKFALFGQFSNFNIDTYFFKLILNNDLTIHTSKTYAIKETIGLARSNLMVFPNGETQFMSRMYGHPYYYWYAEDSSGNLKWQMKIRTPNDGFYIDYNSLQNGNGRSNFFNSSSVNRRNYIELVQVEDKDPLIKQCLGDDTSFVRTQPWSVRTGSWSWNTVKDNETIVTPLALTTSDVALEAVYICSPQKIGGGTAPPFTISGEDTACFTDHSLVYKATLPGGSQPVQWRLDGSGNHSMRKVNDSIISISFDFPESKPDSVKLYAYSGGCQPLQDSLTITLLPGRIDLGKDTAFCNNPIPLNAGSWFRSYSWQDGSRDAVFYASKPGIYWVRAETWCGDFVSDTIELKGLASGITRSQNICKGDSTILKANAMISSFNWQPHYNLLPVSDSAVKIYPLKDTIYIFEGTTINGCIITDTAFIKVNTIVAPDLGADSSICRDESLTLDASIRYLRYRWNTGATSSSIKATQPGAYFVQVESADRCLASDTIFLTNKDCKNRVIFPSAFTPNADLKNDLFRASVEGMLEIYEFKVYSRWGNLVFSTSKFQQGWDGRYKGRPQDPGIFVWTCSYRFRNENTVTTKGTVMLVR